MTAYYGAPTTDMTWADWKTAVWDAMARRFGYPGLAPLEQYMLRSRKEKRCIDCGDPGTQQQTSMIVASVDRYWMCDDCAHYWANKG